MERQAWRGRGSAATGVPLVLPRGALRWHRACRALMVSPSRCGAVQERHSTHRPSQKDNTLAAVRRDDAPQIPQNILTLETYLHRYGRRPGRPEIPGQTQRLLDLTPGND